MRHSSHKLNNSWILLLAVASLLFSMIAPASSRSTAPAYAAPLQGTVFWHAGNFRYLDAITGDLLTFVQGLQHPNNGGYGKLSTTRKGNFNTFLDALFIAIDNSLADGSTGDWCDVKTKAATGVARVQHEQWRQLRSVLLFHQPIREAEHRDRSSA
jgi:hypothetical protein